MTKRHTFTISLLALALTVGAAMSPGTAEAYRATRVPAAVATAQLGDAPLAATANEALAAYKDYDTTGDAKALGQWNTLRDQLADAAATQLGIDPARMEAAWRKADTAHQLVVVATFTQLGVPYKKNRSQPGVAFDCSGLTTWAWSQVGISLQRSSRAQIRTNAKVSRTEAQAGDLVYYPGHVMIYLGVDTAIVHAKQRGSDVQIDTVTKRHRTLKFANPLG